MATQVTSTPLHLPSLSNMEKAFLHMSSSSSLRGCNLAGISLDAIFLCVVCKLRKTNAIGDQLSGYCGQTTCKSILRLTSPTLARNAGMPCRKCGPCTMHAKAFGKGWSSKECPCCTCVNEQLVHEYECLMIC